MILTKSYTVTDQQSILEKKIIVCKNNSETTVIINPRNLTSLLNLHVTQFVLIN